MTKTKYKTRVRELVLGESERVEDQPEKLEDS